MARKEHGSAELPLLLYRGFAIRQAWQIPVTSSVAARCRMQFGDTGAECNSALPACAKTRFTTWRLGLSSEQRIKLMRNTFSLFACLALVGVLASGCIGAQEKLGRGMSNTFEIVRGGETRRSMEQTGDV